MTEKVDPKEHLTVFKTQMMIIGTAKSLQCKLFSEILKVVALRWFMNQPRHSIGSF